MFEQAGDAPRAFLSNYQELGYYKADTLTVLGLKKRAAAYRVDPKTGEAAAAPVDPQLLKEAVAYYQEAFHAFKRGELELRQKAK